MFFKKYIILEDFLTQFGMEIYSLFNSFKKKFLYFLCSFMIIWYNIVLLKGKSDAIPIVVDLTIKPKLITTY